MPTKEDILFQIYTTGAFVSPRLIKGEWRWVVDGFDGGEEFCDGEEVFVEEKADTKEGLIKDVEDE